MPNSLVGIALLVLGCFQTVASDQLTLKKEQMMHNKKIEHMGTIKPRKAAEEKAAASLKVGLMHELSDLGTADAKHDAGLHPHHNVGADENDPLLFRHRYHGHHAETNKLIYYQCSSAWLSNLLDGHAPPLIYQRSSPSRDRRGSSTRPRGDAG